MLRGLANPSSPKESEDIIQEAIVKLAKNVEFMHPKPIDITNPLEKIQGHFPTEATFNQNL